MSAVTVIGHAISDLIRGKTTFSTAAATIGAQVSKVLGATDAASGVLSDMKQAASDAISLGESILGAVVADAAEAVEGAFDVGAAKLIGTDAATALSPFVEKGIDDYANTLITAIKAKALALKSSLMPATAA